MEVLNFCGHGDHGPQRTWCSNTEVASPLLQVSVPNERCSICPFFTGATTPVKRPPQKCKHLGELLEKVTCKTCDKTSTVLHEVYVCTLKGKCVKTRRVAERVIESTSTKESRPYKSLAVCEGCTDRSY